MAENKKVKATIPSLTAIIKNPVTEEDDKKSLLAKLVFLVDEENKSALFAEHQKIIKIQKATDDVLAALAKIAQNDCFTEIKKLAKKEKTDPMIIAATVLRFRKPVVKEEDEIGEDGEPTGRSVKVIDSADVKIDPLLLHKTTKDGIGARKDWRVLVDKLEAEMFAAASEMLGAVTKDGKVADRNHIIATYRMKDESRVFDLGSTIPQMVLATINAMVGEVEISDDDLAHLSNLLLLLHSKAGKGKLEVKGTTGSNFRYRLLEVCNSALTGAKITVDYKEKK